jgi:hypothetical protein
MIENIDIIMANVFRVILDGGWLRAPVIGDIKTIIMQVSAMLSIMFGGVIVYIAIKRRQLANPMPASADAAPEAVPVAPAAGALRGRWNEIIVHLDSARENDWKLAILEADKLVDSALKQAGFPGDTFGDRLTNIQPGTLLSLDGLWWAHRIRNRVAHEMDYFLRYTEARQAVSYYEAVLGELKLI